MKTAFVKSIDARLVKHQKYGFSNREGQLVFVAIYDRVAPHAPGMSGSRSGLNRSTQ
ncbi:MAG TPA: hypothetical protein VJX72_01990 [Candidatus Acidoferrum sp.]|nr:hypothetical protein [Candidatus Acidoferrum sp.]